jgi:hypothetical protein
MRIIQLMGLSLSLLGIYGAFAVSALNFSQASVCPHILFVPVCYLVLFCYVLIAASWNHMWWANTFKLTNFRHYIFVSSSFVVFVLAILGSAGEVMGISQCPKSDSGIAKCFFSFAIITAILVLWWGSRKLNSNIN